MERICSSLAFKSRCGGTPGRPVRAWTASTLVLFDIDHFKRVNDFYDHLGGDAVLVDIARGAAEPWRASDVVGRYGGEEFGIILANAHLQGALVFCERLRSFVESNARSNSTAPTSR